MIDRARFDVLVAPAGVGSVFAAEMTRMESIMIAAGWSIALVADFIRPTCIG
jgi:hypothetical protein